MLKAILAGMLAVALSTVPAIARTAPEPSVAEGEVRIFGLPIFTSDNVQIGAVAETGTDDDGHMMLLAEIDSVLGMGSRIVAIPVELIVLRTGRVDLFLTAAEVRDALSSGEDHWDQASTN